METHSSSSSDRPSAELINIIKDLFYNASGENTEERDRIIKKVELQFTECDANIDQYIRRSSKDLSHLIKVFNEIAKKIENSREKVSHSRDALKQCKVLLQSKRDDVRRLWLEWCEQKFYYENISKLKQLHTSGENIRALCSQKKYLEAAELISDCTSLLNNQYREIAGLTEIKRNIDTERVKLENYLLMEMTEQLYTIVTRAVLETGTVAPVREASFKRRFRRHLNNNSKQIDDAAADLKTSLFNSMNNSVDTDSSTVIERLVKAAFKLSISESDTNVVDKMLNEINRNMTSQLILMINATSTHVLESNMIDNSKLLYSANNKSSFNSSRYRQTVENNPKFLSQLIDLSFEQFKMSAKNYRQFVEYACKLRQTKAQPIAIWTCIQSVLAQLLEEYLDIKQIGGQSFTNNADMIDKMDINAFFVRKRLINLTFNSENPNNNVPRESVVGDLLNQNVDDVSHMFTFKNSSHALSIQQFIKEKNNEDLFDDVNDKGDAEEAGARSSLNNEQRVFKILVCQPDHRK